MTQQTVKRLKTTDLEQFSFPNHFLIIGPTQSGKSHLLKWMIYEKFHQKFDAIYVLTGSEFNSDYDFIADEFKCSDSETMHIIIDGIITTQKKIISEGKPAPRIAIILDDIVGIIDRYKSRDIGIFDLLYSKGRHLNISVFAIIQNITLLSTTIRYNSKYIVYTCIVGTQYDMLYEMTGKGFKSKQEFRDFCDAILVDYHCVCFNAHTSKREVFILKAPKDIPQFRLQV